MDTNYFNTAKNYTEKLRMYNKYPSATSRDAFAGLPGTVKDEILSEGEKYLGFRFPGLLATDYMRFVRTGNRTDFEDIYFEKRHALCALTLAECVEYDGRFVDDIINGVFSICEESGWQLPAHNTYVRDTPQHILPDLCKPIIDLFAAETGALLAWVFYLLPECLDKISPIIRLRILSELHNRIFTPYTTGHFWWMGNGDEKMCNWTAWCTQNVLLSAFLVLDDSKDTEQTLLRKIFIQASESCDCFIKDYGEDGCCDEGAQYYRHAGLCLFGALDILNYVSYGAFNEHFNDTKLKNMASYILNVHAAGEYYFNFADCAAKPGRCGVREYLFGKAVNEPMLCELAAADFHSDNGKLYTGAKDQINLYYLLMTCFNYVEVINYHKNNKQIFNTSNLSDNNIINDKKTYQFDSNIYNNKISSNDIFYKSVGLFIARSTNFSLAVKAGSNDDNHNHNDTGSFIIYKNNIPLFVDIGVESYTQKTFSDRRYEIWTMRSCYHNLPTINDCDEEAGKEYRAENVAYSFTESSAQILMEISKAYPTEHCSYFRTITLDKGADTILLTDTTDCEDAVINFILYEKPSVSTDKFTIGTHTECKFSGADFLDIETLPITDSRLKQSWDHDLYRLRFKLNKSSVQKERSFILEIR